MTEVSTPKNTMFRMGKYCFNILSITIYCGKISESASFYSVVALSVVFSSVSGIV